MTGRTVRVAVGGLGLVLLVGAVAVVALRDGGGAPAKLPVLAGPSDVGDAASESPSGRVAGGDAAAMPIFGNIVYQAGPDLPTLEGDAHAYRLQAAVDTDAVSALAAAFGMSGGVTQDQGGWHVVDGDHQLDVYRSPGAPWSYYLAGVVVSTAVSDGSTPAPPADLPSEADATAIALETLTRAGVDTAGAGTQAFDQLSSWGVQVDPVVDGMETWGFGSYVSVGVKGVVESASGFLAVPARADSYPLTGTGPAIERLNNGTAMPGPRPLGFAESGREILGTVPPDAPATGGVTDSTVCVADGCSGSGTSSAPGSVGGAAGCAADVACVDPAPVPTVPPDSVPDTTVPPAEPTIVTLTDARVVLLFLPTFDGSEAWLVPGYLFDGGDQFQPVALAISDTYFTGPSDQPGTKPGGAPVPLPAPLPPNTATTVPN